MAASRSSCIYRSIHRLFRANQLQALHRCPYESYQFRSKLSCHSKSQNSDDLNDTDPRLLPAEPRRFNNLYLDVSQIDESLEEKLDYSIPRWHEQGVRALWAYTPSAHSHHIPMLIKRGFDFHYAGPGFVLMSKWMAQNDEPNKLPHSPSSIIELRETVYLTSEVEDYLKNPTILSVAGIVHNQRDEILLVQEKASLVARKWKFPGGLANFQEDIDDAIKREIFEETGIHSTFQSVIGFRHQHNVKFGGSSTNCLISDLYIVCRLTVNQEEEQQIKICEKEIYDAQWIPLKDFVEDIDSWPINKEFASILYDNLNADKEKNGGEILGKLQDLRLPCDLSITQMSSVAVPGSKYKLYRSQGK